MRVLVAMVVVAGCQPETTLAPDAGGTDAVMYPPSCSDGMKNGSETDVDCGGTCGACAIGESCTVGRDCENGTCFAGTCGPRMWFATSNGSNVAVPGTQEWVAGAGLSVEAQLYRRSLVFIRWTGTSRYVGGGNSLCALGTRFVVDGTPIGHASWGTSLLVQRGATRFHEPFTSELAVMLEAGPHTISAEMVNGNGYATCNLDGDTGLAYDRSHLAVAAYDTTAAWYAESTGTTGALAGGSEWNDIPGVEVTTQLNDVSLVQVSLSGSQLTQSGTIGHCAYRLVVDGTPLGHANHGQAISVGDIAGGWWAPVSLKWGAPLSGGSHIIKAQLRNSGGATGNCEAGQGNHPYSKFRLLATVTPMGGANQALESTGAAQVFPTGTMWTTVNGLSTTINAGERPADVQIELAGTQRTIGAEVSYCGYRLVIDDTAFGHAAHGQAINVGDGTNSWWNYTGLVYQTTLSPGSHTVRVEARNSAAAGTCGINADAQPYGRMRMLVRNF